MSPKHIVAFDAYAAFEIAEPDLLELVGVDTLPVCGGDNAACYNGFCLNDVCVRYGSTDVICGDSVPNGPPQINPLCLLNPLCGRNVTCGPLMTC